MYPKPEIERAAGARRVDSPNSISWRILVLRFFSNRFYETLICVGGLRASDPGHVGSAGLLVAGFLPSRSELLVRRRLNLGRSREFADRCLKQHASSPVSPLNRNSQNRCWFLIKFEDLKKKYKILQLKNECVCFFLNVILCNPMIPSNRLERIRRFESCDV